MSFRTRLISFFVVIVLLPMVAMGVLVYRLISDSSQGKADARAAGLATAAGSLYESAAATAQADAQALAHDAVILRARAPALSRLADQAGLSAVVISRDGATLARTGDPTAIAPGAVSLRAGTGPGAQVTTLTVSTLTAVEYVRELEAPHTGVIVRIGGIPVAQSFDARVAGTPASLLGPRRLGSFPPRATVSVAGTQYREITQRFPGFGGRAVTVTVLSDLTSSTSTDNSSRLLAAVFIAGFLLLALGFAVLSSRALQGQLTRFLQAARRLAAGDFSARVPAQGSDEFAALAGEFNQMSDQLASRVEELSQERVRLRESVRRIGQTFASNLDRPALLDLALKTAVDATQSDCGRVSARPTPEAQMEQAAQEGPLEACEPALAEAEQAALSADGVARAREGEIQAMAASLRSMGGTRVHGLLAVARLERPYSDDEADLLRSLAGQAALAMENVDLHLQLSRQAVTDELTGLANHGRFQELLSAGVEQVRRYHHPLGLIMLDLDNFKSINDTYGHQQGDLVLRQVGAVLRENSREADSPARYGGEEMALILPHTDLEGAFAIAERVRVAIEQLRVPRTDGGEPLRVTASLGVAASTEADRDGLIAQADAALYEAKRRGKNCTMRAESSTANVVSAE